MDPLQVAGRYAEWVWDVYAVEQYGDDAWEVRHQPIFIQFLKINAHRPKPVSRFDALINTPCRSSGLYSR